MTILVLLFFILLTAGPERSVENNGVRKKKQHRLTHRQNGKVDIAYWFYRYELSNEMTVSVLNKYFFL